MMHRCCVNVRDQGGVMRWLLLCLLVSMLLPVHVTLADDALVLPQGRWRVSVEARFSLPITKRFTPGGGTQDLAADFNRELTSSTFPDLRLVGAAFRLPAGPASFARRVVALARHIWTSRLHAVYGLAEWVSAGVRLSYRTQ